MGKRAHASVNRTNMVFADRRLSVSFLHSGKSAGYILEDINIRKIAKKVFSLQLMTNVIIERIDAANALLIYILTHNSNMLVGEDSKTMDIFKKEINKEFASKYKHIQIGVLPAKNINTDVHGIARSIAYAIESTNGTNYMKLVRTWAEQVNKNTGLLGIFITISGRINGGTIASNQKVKAGIVKAQTLTMDIKKAVYHAKTKTGMMGVKVILSREVENRVNDAFVENDMRSRTPRTTRPYNNRDNHGKFRDNNKPFNKTGRNFDSQRKFTPNRNLTGGV